MDIEPKPPLVLETKFATETGDNRRAASELKVRGV